MKLSASLGLGVGSSARTPFIISNPTIAVDGGYSPHPGNTLVRTPGTWIHGETVVGAWYRNGNQIPDATGPTYVLQAEDGDCSITYAEFPEWVGTPMAMSEGIMALPYPPSNISPPVIHSASGADLYAFAGFDCHLVSNGDWGGAPTSFSYQWVKNGMEFWGATGTTLGTAGYYHGEYIMCRVTAHNNGGASGPSDSNTLPVVEWI